MDGIDTGSSASLSGKNPFGTFTKTETQKSGKRSPSVEKTVLYDRLVRSIPFRMSIRPITVGRAFDENTPGGAARGSTIPAPGNMEKIESPRIICLQSNGRLNVASKASAAVERGR